MEIISGMFYDSKVAGSVIEELGKMRLSKSVSLVALENVGLTQFDTTDGALEGTIAGEALGSVPELLTTVGTVVVPGMGKLIVAGQIASYWGVNGAIDSVLGRGLTESLIDVGLPKNSAKRYVDSLKRGEVLVTVTVSPQQEPMIDNIFIKYNVYDQGIKQLIAF